MEISSFNNAAKSMSESSPRVGAKSITVGSERRDHQTETEPCG